jgi:hypothetical protein
MLRADSNAAVGFFCSWLADCLPAAAELLSICLLGDNCTVQIADRPGAGSPGGGVARKREAARTRVLNSAVAGGGLAVATGSVRKNRVATCQRNRATTDDQQYDEPAHARKKTSDGDLSRDVRPCPSVFGSRRSGRVGLRREEPNNWLSVTATAAGVGRPAVVRRTELPKPRNGSYFADFL